MRVVVFVDEGEDRIVFLDRLCPVLPADAEVTLVHVVNPLVDAAGRFALTNAEAVAGLVAEWESHLAELCPRIPGATAAVEKLGRGEDVADGLIRIATEAGADMLALSTRRAGTFRGRVLGSVADGVMAKARLPILVIHVG